MFALPFRRASPSPGPSSVQLWFLRHSIVISALFVVVSTSSSATMAPLTSVNQTCSPPNQTVSTHANKLDLFAVVLASKTLVIVLAVSCVILLVTVILILACIYRSWTSESDSVSSDKATVDDDLLPRVLLVRYEDILKQKGPTEELRQDPTVLSLPSLQFAQPNELLNLAPTEEFKVSIE